MKINKVIPHHWPDSEIRQQIKRVFPLRTWMRRVSWDRPMELWYPWYFCPAEVRIDTVLRPNQVHADLVAVDAVRPVRQRADHHPEFEATQVGDPGMSLSPDSSLITDLKTALERVPLRLRPDQAREEATDLLTSLVINRNKLLRSHEIVIREPVLYYFRMQIVPVHKHTPEDWVVLEDHFRNSQRLGNRRELMEIVLRTQQAPKKIAEYA